MNSKVREIQYFLHSQQFADGLRTTAAILVPALFFSYIGNFNLGLSISLGALCVSIVDTPGPIIHRRNAMQYSILLLFTVTLITSFARMNPYLLGLEIIVFSFFFSMFNAYGMRATSVGNAALLAIVLTMDKPVEPSGIFVHSLEIAGGGVFYMLLSLLFYKVQPYRVAQRALGECVREMAAFLQIKSQFYNSNTDLDEDYKKLVAQQMVVSEKQDAVRDILFKTRQIVKESSVMGRKMIVAFVDSVDLFEDMVAAYYDYKVLRQKYGTKEVLMHISGIIKQMAAELDAMGLAIQSNSSFSTSSDYENLLADLKKEMEEQTRIDPEGNHLILKKIWINIRKMLQRFTDIHRYFNTSQQVKNSKIEYAQFIGHQSLDPKIFWSNLTFGSTIFKHALRVTIACLVGFIISKLLTHSHHSYWILMTIAFMIKPAFSLTKQRNYERITGTLTGAVIGIVILYFIKDKHLLFAFLVVFMIGTYSFIRVNYFVSVIFLTPFITILFKFLGVGYFDVVGERILDTIIGCIIAVAASYLLFPNWEAEQLKDYLFKMLQANTTYLQKLVKGLLNTNVSITEYKLARKEVYVSSANLSSAFQRMISEPKSKQKNRAEIHQFVVLNHILFSNISTLAGIITSTNTKTQPEDIIRLAKKSLQVLCDSVRKFDKDCSLQDEELSANLSLLDTSPENALLKEQMKFIYRISTDISKVTATILTP